MRVLGIMEYERGIEREREGERGGGERESTRGAR